MIKYVLLSVLYDENEAHYTSIAIFDSEEEAKYMANVFNNVSRIEYKRHIARIGIDCDDLNSIPYILNNHDDLLSYGMLIYVTQEVDTNYQINVMNKITDLYDQDVYDPSSFIDNYTSY